MKVSINMNDSVKVKLTQHGLNVMERNWNEIFKNHPNLGKFSPPRIDENGYAKFQLWSLISEFSGEIGMCKENCFELDIILAD